MPKYNIFKILKSKENDLISKLSSVGLKEISRKEMDGSTLTFYFSENPKAIDIWWVKTYRDFIDLNYTPRNTSYFAVLLISSITSCYAVAMGKTHFYLKEYCDRDFGINLAERISDRNEYKIKNSKMFGSNRNKSIITYIDNSEFEYESGEAIQCIKAKTIDDSKWGKYANFGNSAFFNLKTKPSELPILVNDIDQQLTKEALINIPRAELIKDEDKIKELDLKLTRAIIDTNNSRLEVAETTLSGVDFVFLDKCNFKLSHNRKSQEVDVLSLENLIKFVKENNIDLETELNNINLSISDESNKGYTKKLKYFLEFMDDERNVLIDGKWHYFSQSYVDYVCNQVDKIVILKENSVNLSRRNYETWRKQKEEQGEKLTYPEAYFNSLRESEGYINLDRHTSMLERYTIEKMDLFKEETAFFVKIGSPQKLNHAIDQSLTTLKILQTKNEEIEIDGNILKPKKMCLWIILERRNIIQKISEIKSLIFLIKLTEWRRQCNDAGFVPLIKIGYILD